ncbi:hypothetical protein [Teredinibacter purpureus]|uniref:hypothetical protein n=1 Tax=Teredinibacter purpureus TaxID=2731756 RepID=UPI0013C447CD|nr:hypothetical protein [Teredinibacter purpureus]
MPVEKNHEYPSSPYIKEDAGALHLLCEFGNHNKASQQRPCGAGPSFRRFAPPLRPLLAALESNINMNKYQIIGISGVGTFLLMFAYIAIIFELGDSRMSDNSLTFMEMYFGEKVLFLYAMLGSSLAWLYSSYKAYTSHHNRWFWVVFMCWPASAIYLYGHRW